MPDLRDRFDAADRIPAPDLWGEIERRVASPDQRTARLHVVTIPQAAAEGRRRRIRTVVTVAAALLIGVASTIFLARVFRAADLQRPGGGPAGALERVRGWIAYRGRGGIYAVDPSNTFHVTFLTDDGALDTPIAWSPDGTHLLFTRERPGADPGAERGVDLYVLNPDGSQTRLTADGHAYGGSFTGDGSAVLYGDWTQVADGGIVGSLLRVPVGGGATETVAEGGEHDLQYWYPSVSPDGRSIAFAGVQGGRGARDGIWVMNADGSDPRQIVRPIDGPHGDLVGPISWSPDGARLTFSVYTFEHRHQVWIVSVDGTGSRKLAGRSTGGSWSPDGTRVVVTSIGGDISTVDAETGAIHPVRRGDAPLWNPLPPR